VGGSAHPALQLSFSVGRGSGVFAEIASDLQKQAIHRQLINERSLVIQYEDFSSSRQCFRDFKNAGSLLLPAGVNYG
jgi:hypothetical protein